MMEIKPLISVVTVCYNSEKTIKDTIESVISQTYSNIEYILVDGNSTDNTVEIIKSYEETAIEKGINYRWISEPDKGIYDAMNKGIGMATGELIGIINSDDWYSSINVLEAIANDFEKEKFDLLHGNLNIHSRNGKIIKVFPKNQLNYKKSMPIYHPTCFITKATYEVYGKYKTNFQIAADYDLIYRYLSSGVKVRYLNKTISDFRDEGISSLNEKKSLLESHFVRKENGMNKILSYIYFVRAYYFGRVKNKFLNKVRK